MDKILYKLLKWYYKILGYILLIPNFILYKYYKPKTLIILGMHRSGTSCMTRIFNLCNVNLGKTLMKAKFDNPKGISQVMSKCIKESSKIFKNFRPDLLIVLGDRYEILASTISAHFCRIPVAHIHGGEVTQAVIDDAFRHSITKMSHIHFVANKIYKKRVIQLGENPKNIFIFGKYMFSATKNLYTIFSYLL